MVKGKHGVPGSGPSNEKPDCPPPEHFFFKEEKTPAAVLPPVLVPGLDLRVCEVEGGRQLHAVLDAQVLLTLEAALQLRQLVVREGRPGLPGLLQPDLRAVSAAGDLPVAFLFHCREENRKGAERRRKKKKC